MRVHDSVYEQALATVQQHSERQQTWYDRGASEPDFLHEKCVHICVLV
jgi:hypothetical protein